MDGDEFYGSAYKGSKQFTQHQVKTANATGFGAAADDYMERGIDLNEQLVTNKPATSETKYSTKPPTGKTIMNNCRVSRFTSLAKSCSP